MVHGSPRPVANEEMFRVVEVVKARGAFDHVQVGFMECNEPTIPDAIDACVAHGDDLPTLLEEAQERHPHVAFSLGRYIGTSPRLTDVLADRAAAAVA